MSEKVLATFEGEGGAVVTVTDQTAPYAYQNIFHVKLVVEARFSSTPEVFTRKLEKMGVFAEEVEGVKESLLNGFRETGLPYLLRCDFAQKLEAARAREKTKAVGYGKVT